MVAVTMRYSVNDNRAWRYVEIDGVRIEFCHWGGCPLKFFDCTQMHCSHPNGGTHCIMHYGQLSCPARLILGVKVCPSCNGEGEYDGVCQACSGTGKIDEVV